MLCGCAVREIELHGKLVALGYRHHSLRLLYEQHCTRNDQCRTRGERCARMVEAAVEQPCVARLQIVEGLFACIRLGLGVDAIMY